MAPYSGIHRSGAALWAALADHGLKALQAAGALVSALYFIKVLMVLGAVGLWICLAGLAWRAWRVKLGSEERAAAARQQVERLLRESDERLRLATETAPMGTWDLNLVTGQIYWSANMWALFGLTPDPENLRFEIFKDALHPEDRERVLATVDHAIKNNTPYICEFRIVYPDGRIRWSLANGRCITDGQGKPVRLVGVDLDITARKEAEVVLQASEQRFRTLARVIHDAVWDRDLATGRIIWSDSLTALFGYPILPETEDPQWWRDRVHPGDLERVAAILADAFAGRAPVWSIEYRLRRADGSYAHVLSRGQVLRDDRGQARWVMGALMDITQRKRVEEALRESEKRLKLALGASRMGVFEWNIPTGSVFWSEECFSVLGVETFDGTIDGFSRMLHPDDAARCSETLQQAITTHTNFTAEFRIVHPDGAVRWLSILARAEYDEAGVPLRMIGTVVDIHQRKQSEFALEHQRRRMEGIVNSAMDGIITINEDQRIEVFNTAAEQMFGYSAGEILGHNIARLLPLHVTERYREQIRRFGQAAEAARHSGRLGKISGRRCSGEEFPIAATISKIQLDGRMLYTVTCRDLTERVMAETMIRDSQERFGQLAGHIREVFWVKDVVQDRLSYISPAYEEIWGRKCDALYLAPDDWLAAIHPADRDAVLHAVKTRQAAGDYDETYRILRPDGALRWIHDRAFPVYSAAGQLVRIDGIAEDITARRALEEQLLQAQKLEAIGLLAGGVAHDFNNLLTVIKGNASLMLLSSASPEQIQDGTQEIVKAAERAASLTRQLLLFSRKQTLQLTKLDLNETVADMLKMLQRILGADIVLLSEYAPKLPLIGADAGMIEQVLLNLAVNARDAMPDGGQLRLATTVEVLQARQATPEAPPGTYVCLTFSDTGSGIAKEHLAHIFEPFFTTKEVGKGTGLGLATVYGIVKQHRGRIDVSSKINSGTTFRIAFPALPVTAVEDAVSARGARPPRGHETVLLVEDELAVRRLVASLLTQAGYTVLQATTGLEALKLWEAHADKIHLLLTDLILPGGLTGRELAARLQAERPELRVLFTSGNNPEPGRNKTMTADGVNFIPKPYQPKKLVGMVRDCLDRN